MTDCLHGFDTDWCALCAGTDAGVNGSSGPLSKQGELKQEVLNDITELLGMDRIVPLGVGSSIPSEVFEIAAQRVGVPSGSMPEICEAIVLKSGQIYSPDFDSRKTFSGGGSTVTLLGLQAMRGSLRQLLQ